MVVVTETTCGVGGADEKPNPTGGSNGATPPRSCAAKLPVTAVMSRARRTP